MKFALSRMGQRAHSQPISYLMAVAAKGDCISLAAGLVDEETLPSGEVRECVCSLLEKRGNTPLQYAAAEGLLPLREKVRARLLAADDIHPDSIGIERVRLSTGSQQMLYILTELMVDPGDIVITPAPSYFVYLSLLETVGARVRTVDIDEHGLKVDALRRLLEKMESEGELARVKIIYVTSYFQNPAGVSLSTERKKALIETIKSFDSFHPLVIEDAAYRELAFKGDDRPSLLSLDPRGGMVAYLGTFSKPFSPGLRTGFSVLPEALLEKVTVVKGNHDFGSAGFSQHVIDAFFEKGLYDEHVAGLQRVYRQKCELMCESIEREFGDAAEWVHPEGGLYVWLDIPGIYTGMDGEFFKRCLANGVLYVPGEFAFAEKENAPKSRLRLSFGPTPADDIAEGIARLAATTREISAKL